MQAYRWWSYRRAGSALWAWCIVVVALTLLVQPLAAEEAVQPAAAGSAAALKERAGAFWEAKVKKDYAAQVGFFEPKLQRTMSVDAYIQRQGPVQYLEAHVEGVKVEEARGFVTVRLRVQVQLPQQKTPTKQETVVQDEWVRRGGEWYRLYPQG